MKSYRKELFFEVPTRRAFINITRDVQQCINDSGVSEGLVLVNAMHITRAWGQVVCCDFILFDSFLVCFNVLKSLIQASNFLPDTQLTS